MAAAKVNETDEITLSGKVQNKKIYNQFVVVLVHQKSSIVDKN